MVGMCNPEGHRPKEKIVFLNKYAFSKDCFIWVGYWLLSAIMVKDEKRGLLLSFHKTLIPF